MKNLKNPQKNLESKKGIALFIAVIAVSAIMILTLSIADISFKEQILTYAGKDSKVAFYAADSGLECALFHDVKKADFFFATIQVPTQSGTIKCNNLDVNNPSITTSPSGPNPTATTIFSFNLSGSSKSCAVVIVTKTGSGPSFDTSIEARGYNNTCDTAQNTVDPGVKNLERSLEVNY